MQGIWTGIGLYVGLLVAARLVIALTCGPRDVVPGESWLHRNFARPVPSHTFWAFILPIAVAATAAVFAPISASSTLRLCLEVLGLMFFLLLWLIRSPFEILGLRQRGVILATGAFCLVGGLASMFVTVTLV